MDFPIAQVPQFSQLPAPAAFDNTGYLNALGQGRAQGQQARSQAAAYGMGNALARGNTQGAVAAAAESGDPSMVAQAQQSGQSAQQFAYEQQGRQLQAFANAAVLADTPQKYAQLRQTYKAQLGHDMDPEFQDFNTGRQLLLGRLGLTNAPLERSMLTAQTSLAGTQAQQAQIAIAQMKQQMALVQAAASRQGLNGVQAPPGYGGQPGATPAQPAPGPWRPGQAPAAGTNQTMAQPPAAVPLQPQQQGANGVGYVDPNAAAATASGRSFDQGIIGRALGIPTYVADVNAQPEMKGAAAFSEQDAKNQADNKQGQLVGSQVMKLYDDIENEARSNPSALAWAIGPQNNGPGPHIPIPFSEGMTLPNLRDTLSTVGRTASTLTGNVTGSGDPFEASAGMRAKLQAARAGIARMSTGNAGTDSQLKNVQEEIGSMIENARNPEQFFQLLNQSRRNARAVFKLDGAGGNLQPATQQAGGNLSDPLGIR